MRNEAESERIRSALKEVLDKKGIRYKEIAKALSLSVPRFKTLMSKGNLSLERVMKICDFLDMSFYDLTDLARNKMSENQQYLTEEQESYLLKHPSAARYYIEIMNGKSPEQIARVFGLTERSDKHYLSTMEMMGLIQKRGKRIKLKNGVPLGPRPGGALANYLLRSYSATVPRLVKSEISILAESQNSQIKTGSFRCSGFNLSRKSRQNLKRDLEEIWNKYLLIEHLEYDGDEEQDVRPMTLMILCKEYDLFASAFPEIRSI
jgi:DNA-binding CsgD family transcriptional regulator